MGTPLPPNEPGEDCTVCWGTDKTFGPGHTPKYLWLRITELTPGAFWNPALEAELLLPHLLVQTEAPCGYGLMTPNISYSWGFAYGRTYVLVADISTGRSFLSNNPDDECATSVRDWWTEGSQVAAYGGLGTISWNPEYLE